MHIRIKSVSLFKNHNYILAIYKCFIIQTYNKSNSTRLQGTVPKYLHDKIEYNRYSLLFTHLAAVNLASNKLLTMVAKLLALITFTSSSGVIYNKLKNADHDSDS